MTALAPTLQAFFTDRLATQRHASGRTVAAYRDTFRLLVSFVSDRTGTPPSKLDLADLGAPAIGAFLLHLEQQRHNSVRTRNARLAAIHSFFRYAALHHPEHADLISRVLSIPHKRYARALVCFLTLGRNPGAARHPGPAHLDRPPRPRDAPRRGADRPAGSRAHRAALPRRRPHYRTARPLHRERQEGTLHATDATRRGDPAQLARRARREPRRPTVPEPAWHDAQHRCGGITRHQVRQGSRTRCPVAHRQESNPARAQAHMRHGPARSRHRHRHHRPVARPRTHRLGDALHARRPRHQATGAGPHHPARQSRQAATGPPTACSPS